MTTLSITAIILVALLFVCLLGYYYALPLLALRYLKKRMKVHNECLKNSWIEAQGFVELNKGRSGEQDVAIIAAQVKMNSLADYQEKVQALHAIQQWAHARKRAWYKKMYLMELQKLRDESEALMTELEAA